MTNEKRVISGQLRLGDAEVTSYGAKSILAKITAAHTLAGMTRLLFLPSHIPELNQKVVDHCRELGVETYLWYKVLADNDIIAHEDELNENAWGWKGAGKSGVWPPLFDSEETFLFACPNNRKYNNLLYNRCAQALESYSGLFIDCIGFPLPSLGLESVFSCFCPDCRRIEPRLDEWRKNVQDYREMLVSASDADLDRFDDFDEMLAEYGMADFFAFRKKSIANLSRRYAELARQMGKGVGLDVVSPCMMRMSGHDYKALGELVDWLKPRIYFRTFGPSSISLELYCLAMGMKTWGKRYSLGAVLRYIGRSTRIKMPNSIHALEQNHLPDEIAVDEMERAMRLADCPVHPGLEFSLHPEFDAGLDTEKVRRYIAAARNAPGLVLTWNILYIPDNYLQIIGENL